MGEKFLSGENIFFHMKYSLDGKIYHFVLVVAHLDISRHILCIYASESTPTNMKQNDY
jgi:hypothetical protein